MTAKKTPKNAKTSPEAAHARYPIVGIGASAGGLEAFKEFFAHVPADCPAAFVLIPHLDPDHASILAEILQRSTSLPVAEATEGQRIAARHVFVIPPNRDMIVADGALRLELPGKPRGLRMPIDTFLRSLAEAHGKRAVGIILSGTGSDGTQGLRAIADAGGVALVQDPLSAQYDGMPGSAIAAGISVHVLAPRDMPAVIMHFSGRAVGGAPPPADEPVPASLTTGDALTRILTVLRSTTGHDFSRYKKNTMLRRIARRMAAQCTDDASHYAQLLRNDGVEIRALFKELLINVSGFFRDAEAFEALKNDVLRPYLAERPDDFVFRAWVAGCANGEEAYSIAIVLHELMEETQRAFSVQIYATDLDDEAIDRARAGRYPASIAADITPARLTHGFAKSGTQYVIRKSLRDMVVFAVHDVLKDPPFTRLDLLSCRNLLIYLEPEAQQRLLRTFHYALESGGVLFLSPSESIGEHAAMFSPLHRKWKLYRATPAPAAPRVLAATGMRWPAESADRSTEHAPVAGPRDFATLTRDMLLRTFAPTSVLVDATGNILFVHGDTDRYLRPAPGQASLNVVTMAHPALQLDLFSALQTATRQTAPITREVAFPETGAAQKVGLTVQALTADAKQGQTLLISFQDIEAPVAPPGRAARRRGGHADAASDAQRVAILERDLADTHEKLQSIIEAQQSSNEELHATNEEMQSANEELQSTNEELETSKEELHAINEELISVNAELQAKIVQLNAVQDDMKNLLDNVATGVVFLDAQLRIRRFTRDATRIYRLVDGDVGRALADIKSGIVGADPDALLVHAQAVLDTLAPLENTVRLRSGETFLVRIKPYRTIDNLIDGVVLTFSDITARTALEARERAARQLAESIIDTVREPLVVLDAKLKVISVSRAFCELFDTQPEATVGRAIYALGRRELDVPALRNLLDNVLPNDNAFTAYALEADLPGAGRRTLELTGRRIIDETASEPLILLTIASGPAADDTA